MTVSHPIHPARGFDVADLLAGLKAARASRLVYQPPGPDGLLLYVYSGTT
jgi:hypothetical protein